MQYANLRHNNRRSNLGVHSSKNDLLEIGLILKDAREKKRFSVKDIRSKTCIPIHHILAIENGVREQLPEEVFLIGFIKRYARAVGINDEILCNKYLNCKNPNEESNAFDLLFQEQKVINLDKTSDLLDGKRFEKGFLKVYHFYFLIIAILFLSACYLVFQINNESNKVLELSTSFLMEDDDTVYVKQASQKSKITEISKISKVNSPKQKEKQKEKINETKPDPTAKKINLENINKIMLRPPIKEINQ